MISKRAGKVVLKPYLPKHRGATPDTNLSPFAAASQRSRAGLPAQLPGNGRRIKKNMSESAFGVEHGGEVSKAMNPFKAFKAKQKPKAAPTRSFEDPFAGPKSSLKGISPKQFESSIIKPGKPKGLMPKNSSAYDRNAGLGSSFKGNQGGMSVQSRRTRDLG